jgi:hypothetical protein
LPVKITSKPLFSGMGARGRLPGIRYISSVIKKRMKSYFCWRRRYLCYGYPKNN